MDRGAAAAELPVRRLSARAERHARVATRLAAPRAASDEASDLTTPSEWRARGRSRRAPTVYGPMYEKLRVNMRALHPALDAWMIVEGYGKVLGRPGLDLPRRELCIVAAVRGDGPGPAAALAPARRAERRRGAGAPRGARRDRRPDRCRACPIAQLLLARVSASSFRCTRSLVRAIADASATRRLPSPIIGMFIDRVIVRVEGRRRRLGHRLLPPREVRPAGRAGRRRRRTRRGRHRSRRQQPRHAARLHLPRRVGRRRAATTAAARNKTGASGDDIVLPVPPGTDRARSRDAAR